MSKEMRRQDRRLPEKDASAILKRGAYGVLSTADQDGVPYGVPLNYVYLDGAVYFHCALEGHKLDNIAHQEQVSFCIVGKGEVLPHKFSILYESVIVRGQATEVKGKAKERALLALLEKFTGEYIEKGRKYLTMKKDNCRVFKIIVHNITGKGSK